MSNIRIAMVVLSLGFTACQQTRNGAKKSEQPAQTSVAPAAGGPQQGAPPPQTGYGPPPPNTYAPPPPPVLTDETGGQLGQSGQPYTPPPQAGYPPPTYNPPPQTYTPPPQTYTPPPQPQSPPPQTYTPPPQTYTPPPQPQSPPPQTYTPPPQPQPQPQPTYTPPPATPQPVEPTASTQTPPPVPQVPQPQVTFNQTPPPQATTPTPVPTPRPTTAPRPVEPTASTQAPPPVPKVEPKLVEWNKQPLPDEPKPCTDPNGCGTQVVKPEPPPPQEDCSEVRDCVPPDPIKARCTAPLRVDKQRNKLDILFVVDTSASLRTGGIRSTEDGELIQIARGMKEFVKNLDPETDYRIGVLTGHGPASPYHGKLIGSGGTDSAVIDYKSIARGQSRARAEAQVAHILERKMRAVPNESGGAQGEALLLALYDSITKAKLRKTIEAQGLFRPDAALNVIFVTDEQDVCFDYEGTKYSPTLKTIKHKGGKTETIPDPYETKFFNEVCKKAANGKPLTPGFVHEALRSLKAGDDSKLIMNAIMYNQEKLPEDLIGKVEDENEMGHGIVELMQMSDGKTADLANVYLTHSQFVPELNLIGKGAKFRLKYNNTFQCTAQTEDGKAVHPDAFNFTSIEAKIIDGKGEHIATFSGACKKGGECPDDVAGPLYGVVKVDTRGKHTPYAEVSVDMDTLKYFLERNHVEDGHVEMEFSTSSNRDPSNGMVWNRKQLKPRPKPQQSSPPPPPPAPAVGAADETP